MPEKTEKTRATQFKDYCLGISALSALILGVWANLKGEPKADKTWVTSRQVGNETRKQQNALAREVQKLHMRIVFLQAHQEGFNSGKLWSELQVLKNRREVPKPVTCKAGYTAIGGKCVRKPTAAVKVLSDQLEHVKQKLEIEQLRRKAVEVQAIKQAKPNPVQQLAPIPANIDEASKK